MSHPRSDEDRPPLPPVRRSWAPLLSGMGSLALLAAGGQTVVTLAQSAQPAVTGPAMASAAEAPVPEPAPAAPATRAPDVVAPSAPAAPPGEAVMGSRAASNAGRIGSIGPISGPLNTDLSGTGPVFGPQWTKAPLPAVTGRASMPGALTASAPPGPAPAAPPAEGSSELPDPRKIALSQLANPQAQVRSIQPAAKPEVSAEKPLGVQLSVARPAKGYQVGDPVTVQVSASADAYLALIRVNAAGQAGTLLQTSRPSRVVRVALPAGPEAGAEYLLAVASVRPLNGAEIAAALRSSGAGFATVPAAALGGADAMNPGTAWGLAVARASGIDGPAAKWQRHEWAVATASFGTRPAARVASKPAAKPAAPEKTPAAKPPAPAEASAIPEMKPEAPAKVEPQPKPAEAPAKPVETPSAPKDGAAPDGKPAER